MVPMHAAIDYPALIDRVRSGEERAIGELLARFEADVRLAARRALGPLLRGQVDSMDLVQSVFRRFVVGLKQDHFDLSCPERLGRILRVAVRNRAADCYRKRRRQDELFADAVATGRRSAADVSDDDHVRDRDLADLLEYVQGFLTPTEHRAVVLRLQGLSTTEAAQVIGIDPDLLRVRLNRMRARLPQHCERLAESI